MEYKASLDTLCKVMTAFVLVLIPAIFTVLFIVYGDSMFVPFRIASIIFILLILFITYIYAPRGYSLEDHSFTIKRIAKNKVIKIEDISEVYAVPDSDFPGTIRTFGASGFFGYYGKYYNSKLGNMTWYVTQRKNRILIKTTKGKKIIVSPDDATLVDALQSKMRR